DKLIGAMLVGNTQATSTLVQVFDRDDPIPADPLELLCTPRSAATATERVVCNCHRVTESAIREAVAAGTDSVDALGAATRAGTGCGSCKTELGALVALKKKAPVLEVAS